MVNNKNTYEILIGGDIGDIEVNEINQLYQEDNIPVNKTISKGHPAIHGLDDIVDLIFQDYNLIIFTRDFILATLINESWKKLKKAINFLKERKNKKVQVISIDYELKIEDKVFILNVVFSPDKYKTLIDKIDLELTYERILENIPDRTIHIHFENDNLEIEFY